MVNASLNLVSFLGLLLFAWWFYAGSIGLQKINYALNNRKDAQTSFIPRSAIIIQSFGRMVGLPMIAFIYFFQGWRMEERLQLSVVLLIIGLLVESAPGVLSDDYRLKVSRGRTTPFADVVNQDAISAVTESKSNNAEGSPFNIQNQDSSYRVTQSKSNYGEEEPEKNENPDQDGWNRFFTDW